jgi:hypothetical protein
LLKLIFSFALSCIISVSLYAAVNNQNLQPEQADFQLTPYTAKYEATWKAGWFPVTIDATRTLVKEDNHWQVSFEAYSSLADLSEISEFTLVNQHILPIYYRYKTSGFLSKKLRTLEFNREEEKTWLPYKKQWANYELTNEIQDHLSYQEQVRIDLMNGKTSLSYPVAYKSRLKNYEFEVIGHELISTGLGRFNATKVARVYPKGKFYAQHAWFIPELNHTLARLWRMKKGVEQYDLVISSYQEAQAK